MGTSKTSNARAGGTTPWIPFAGGLVAGLILGVVVMNVLGGPGGGARSSAPAPVTPAQQQAPDRIRLTREVAQLEELVKGDPGNYKAWVQLGNNLFDLHESQRSIDAYRKALAINGSDPNVWTDLGVMYRDLKNFPQAISSFRKATSLSATHPESRLNLGVVYLNDLNDYKNAIAAWEDFLRVEPSGQRAESIRQQIEQMRGMAGGQTDLDKAAAELQKKLDAPPPAK